MNDNDTIKLLQECDAGARMAVSSINEVLDQVKDREMKSLLCESREHHEKLGDEIHSLLTRHGSEANAMAKGMSWMKTNLKMGLDSSDATVADLITDGCNMGIKSLHKYLNQYQAADKTSKSICGKLSDIEETLCKDMRKYL